MGLTPPDWFEVEPCCKTMTPSPPAESHDQATSSHSQSRAHANSLKKHTRYNKCLSNCWVLRNTGSELFIYSFILFSVLILCLLTIYLTGVDGLQLLLELVFTGLNRLQQIVHGVLQKRDAHTASQLLSAYNQCISIYSPTKKIRSLCVLCVPVI